LPRKTRRDVIDLVRNGEGHRCALAEAPAWTDPRRLKFSPIPAGAPWQSACKGAGLNRAAFSAIALLSAAGTDLTGRLCHAG